MSKSKIIFNVFLSAIFLAIALGCQQTGNPNQPQYGNGGGNGSRGNLAGKWQFTTQSQTQYGMLNCEWDEVFVNTGSFTSMSVCNGAYAMRLMGEWGQLPDGSIRMNVLNWEPKQDQAGNPIYQPPGRTMQVRFINQNQAQFSFEGLTVMATRVQ